MKKLLYFFAVVVCAMLSPIFFADKIYADTPVQTDNEFLQSKITANENITLTKNLILSEWEPLNYSGTFDGNGFTVTTDAPLFNTLTNATIQNLGVVACENFSVNIADFLNKNFGLLAQDAEGSDLLKVFASGSQIKVNVNSGSYIGSLVGYAKEGSVFSNCYSHAQLEVNQAGIEALHTTIGGLIGGASNSVVQFSYAVPYNTRLVYAEVNSDSTSTLNVGGLIGESNLLNVVNVFSGGVIDTNYLLSTSEQNIGLIFGTAVSSSAENMAFCNTFAEGTDAYIGKISSSNYKNFKTLSSSILSTLSTYGDNYTYNNERIWSDDSWDTAKIWCKSTTLLGKSPYLVLQVFENFIVSTSAENFGDGIAMTIKKEVKNGDDFTYETTEETSFKYGTKLQLYMTISDKFLVDGTEIDFTPYKVIGSLYKLNPITEMAGVVKTDDYATFDLVVDGDSAGGYYATSENITYNLLVKTKNKDQGLIKYNTSIVGFEQKEYTLEYGSEYTFVASGVSNTYDLDKWSWVGSETSCDVYRGASSSTALAQNTITLVFGKSGVNSLNTYLTADMFLGGSSDNIPYAIDEVTKKITFTLEASFTEETVPFTIGTNLSAECCDLFVAGEKVSGITDYTEMYNKNNTIDRAIVVQIVAKEGYTFERWETASGKSLSNFINTSSGETETSTTINLKFGSEFNLVAIFSKDDAPVADLTWLWWTLCGVGGAGLITLLVVLIVKKKRRESFISY